MDVYTPTNQNEQSIQCLGLGVAQKVDVGGTTAATASALAETTRVIRVAVSTACHIAIADAPTATTSTHYMPAGCVEYFRVEGGEKVAFIQSSASGIATVTEMK